MRHFLTPLVIISFIQIFLLIEEVRTLANTDEKRFTKTYNLHSLWKGAEHSMLNRQRKMT